MKYLKFAAGILLLVLVPIVLASTVQAQRFTNRVDRGETVDGSLYGSGRAVRIYGTINGDIFCIGQEITINAVVNGDVICAGRDIAIVGRVNGDARLAGESVFIDADIRRSATVAARDFTLDVGASIGNDLTVSATTQRIKGDIDRDFVASGTTVVIAGGIGRNTNADSSTLRIDRGAVIGGSLTYAHETKVDKDRRAEVLGDTTRKPETKRDQGLLAGISLLAYLFILLGLLLVGIVLALLFPGLLLKTSAIIKMSFLKTLVVGVLASIFVPIVLVLLAATLIGLPLALALLVAWLLVIILSGPVAAFYVGRLIMRDRTKSLLLLVIVGAVVLATLYIIPFIGMLLLMVACWLGIGAIVLTIQRDGRTRPDDDREAPPLPAP